MAYFRLKIGKPWHIAIPWQSKSLCNVSATDKAFFVKTLREGEVLCENCASLEERAHPKPQPVHQWIQHARKPMTESDLLATQAQVYRLRSMGYSEEEASIMSRGEAHRLIGEQAKLERQTV